MPKFLFRGAYSLDGIKGVQREGGTARKEVAAAVAESMGGAVEAYYFAFGPHDFYIIAELPDHAAAVAVAATVGASGAMRSFDTIPLLTPEEVDDAMQRTVSYRPPGS
jgi:uncharacterized protein with GYD domain